MYRERELGSSMLAERHEEADSRFRAILRARNCEIEEHRPVSVQMKISVNKKLVLLFLQKLLLGPS
jgi:hypothetical protein